MTGVPLDLSTLWDNVAATGAKATGAGEFNVWGNSFAAEQMPGVSLELDGVGFRLGPLAHPRAADNLRCDGQFLSVPAGDYDWIHVVAAGERRVEAEFALHFADGTADFEAIRVSDFWAAPGVFGERVAFRSTAMHYPFHVQFDVPATFWHQRVPVTRRAPLTGIRLPRNPALHVAAITLLPGAVPSDSAIRPSSLAEVTS